MTTDSLPAERPGELRRHIDDFLTYLALERGLSETTRVSYAQDLGGGMQALRKDLPNCEIVH